jgi:prophage tail gpP-like protein
VAFEDVEVIAGGQSFKGWTQVTILAGLQMQCPTAVIQATEVPDSDTFPAASYFEKWHFPPFTGVQVMASGTIIITGYVNTYGPRMARGGQHSVELMIRGNQMNAVDSSAYHPTGEWVQTPPEQIISELASRVGVETVTLGSTGGVQNIFRLQKGETIVNEALRLLQPRMATLYGDPYGKLNIIPYGYAFGAQAGILAQGVNIEEMSATLSADQRFDEYYVLIQSPVGTDDESLDSEGHASDPAVPLPRTKIINNLLDGKQADAQRRAEWQAARSFGFSCQADITVPGWRDQAGKVWRPGFMVFVYAPALKLDQNMLIEVCTFRQDQTGTFTDLHLVHPAAYGMDAGKVGSHQMWNGPPINQPDED